MKKYNLKICMTILMGLTLIMGALTILVSGWFILGVIFFLLTVVHIYNRSTEISHYCVGVDLDTNQNGDIIEIMIYAFHSIKNQYYPIGMYYKKLKIYVNVVLLDKFYENIGYKIREDVIYGIRLVDGSKSTNIKDVKKFYKQMIKTVNKSYLYSANSMQDRNIEQPSSSKNIKLRGRLWSWWTFKQFT